MRAKDTIIRLTVLLLLFAIPIAAVVGIFEVVHRMWPCNCKDAVVTGYSADGSGVGRVSYKMHVRGVSNDGTPCVRLIPCSEQQFVNRITGDSIHFEKNPSWP